MRILAIVGPTAAGKTALAIDVARRIRGEIISADSRQIYKHLDIGTAKPDRGQRKTVRFHLIDIVEPDEDYSCGQFARDAAAAISEIRRRGRAPVVCGGTGLYIQALFSPLDELPRSDRATKQRLRAALEQYGIEHLYRKLMAVDPEWARQIKPQDKQRILRGLEVYETAGTPMSRLLGRAKQRVPILIQPVYIGLRVAREVLYARIDQRFDEMLKQGLVQEVAALLARGIDPSSSALRTIGYREIVGYLQGRTTLEEAAATAKRRTRNYAKRQLTWFKRLPGIEWRDPQDPDLALDIAARRAKNGSRPRTG